MLAKNRPKVIVNDGKLDDARSDNLVALQDGFLFVHNGASFHVEPYSPHSFNCQFEFCQRILEVVLEDPRFRVVSYEDVLYY